MSLSSITAGLTTSSVCSVCVALLHYWRKKFRAEKQLLGKHCVSPYIFDLARISGLCHRPSLLKKHVVSPGSFCAGKCSSTELMTLWGTSPKPQTQNNTLLLVFAVSHNLIWRSSQSVHQGALLHCSPDSKPQHANETHTHFSLLF